ncbi:hypothetical protein ACFO1B_23250 [Dactylosporangium siamense]|uniref:Uncharacterized protein n=1 Tax=Dactylosporangium siamense TaxID=685454 RepID=A0A919UDY4_9ACTN|nr:hypothetical protein [Dactylosporangium siamense]GIG47113.1 hypothetical protein Dsi01nite_051540 [Dactylosporangium siamense]
MINEYQARYRVSRTVWGLVTAGLIAGTVALLVGGPDVGPLVAAGCYAAPGTILALYGHAALTRKVGLRVDERGIEFGGRPPLYRVTSDFVAWPDISAVYLFRVRLLLWTETYVGFEGHDGPAPLAQRIPANVVSMIWHVPADVVAASRSTNGFPVDRAAFIAAVHLVAPDVPVVDLTAVAPMLTPTPRRSPFG